MFHMVQVVTPESILEMLILKEVSHCGMFRPCIHSTAKQKKIDFRSLRRLFQYVRAV